MKYIIMMLLMIFSVSAYEINSTTYSADRYWDGVSGSIGDSASYSLRQTGHGQGTNPDASSATYQANVGVYEPLPFDDEAPSITLIAPNNDSVWTISNTVIFEYNVSDVSIISSCTLFINSIQITNDTTITNGINSFSRVMVNGPYTWYILCQDQYSNSNTSLSYVFNMSFTPGSGGGGVGGATPLPAPEETPRELEAIPTGPKIVIPLSNTVKYLFLLLVVYSAWLFFVYKRDEEEKRKKRPGDLFVK